MAKKRKISTTKDVYHQKFPLVVIVVFIASGFATYFYYSDYGATGSVVSLVLANISLLIAIIVVKPIVEWRRVEIDNESITIFKLFFKPIKVNISKSLYQVVMRDEEIQSFRFRVGDNRTQVSPLVYKNGDKLAERLKSHIARNRLVVDVVK